MVENMSDLGVIDIPAAEDVSYLAPTTEDSCYRTLGGGNRHCMIGCGSMTKQSGWDGREWRCDHYSAVLCLSGSATYSHAGGTWPVGPGTLFHRHPGHAHNLYIAEGNWRECWVVLGETIWTSLFECGIVSPTRGAAPIAQPQAWAIEVERATADLRTTREIDLPRFLPRLVALVTDTLVVAHRGTHAELIERACVGMGENPRLDLAALAREGGLSFERFRKLFRAQVGLSPGDYLIQRRIDRARTLLNDPSLSVGAVAEILGYPDVFSFSTQFRKRVGSSPRHWRSRGVG